jgi:hypothetical protein
LEKERKKCRRKKGFIFVSWIGMCK